MAAPTRTTSRRRQRDADQAQAAACGSATPEMNLSECPVGREIARLLCCAAVTFATSITIRCRLFASGGDPAPATAECPSDPVWHRDWIGWATPLVERGSTSNCVGKWLQSRTFVSLMADKRRVCSAALSGHMQLLGIRAFYHGSAACLIIERGHCRRGARIGIN
jgi:hypothetical protein